MKHVNVGFLGCGNVGCGVWGLLHEFSGQVAHRSGIAFDVKRILVKAIDEPRPCEVPRELLTERAEDVLGDPEITLVVEFMGGEQPATDFMLRALKAGKSVVTANKVALSLNWHLLQAAAQESGAGLYYEASVGGAIPVLHAITDSLQANRIDTIMGIINGTTNYILTRMSKEGGEYEAVLRDAQALGLAEPDPSADVEGYDAAYKLSILSSLAFHAHVPVKKVFREGITRVTAQDIACGKQMGLTLKLLAVAKRDGQLVEVRVHPTFVPDTHPLATVSGAFNAVFLHGHACGDMMFYGQGAGGLPTAGAVVSDMIKFAQAPAHRHPTFANDAEAPDDLNFDFDWRCVYFIRMTANDAPGVLAGIAGCLGRYGVSIASMRQDADAQDGRASIIIVTHTAHEQSVMQALDSLDEAVAVVDSIIRVEE